MVIAEMTVTTRAAIEDDERWQAVLARDAAYDGAFVGAVLSTRIYCRPSCPARRPARERVVFFDTPDLAEAAGFRACLRCDPRGEKPDRGRLVKEICEFLDGESEERITLAALGSRFGVSPYHLQRTFKRAMGVSPHQYAAARRVERLKEGLRNGSDVTGALYDAGYGSSSRLYESAGVTLGMTPAAYRRRGSGMSIRYTIVDSQLGRLLVGATERGVCSVKMGDRDEGLEATLRKEYPAAQIERSRGGGPGELSEWVEALLQHIATGEPSVKLPLDIRVTAFQGRVYQALRSIANGQTRSYAEIAREIGRPKAVRAVANACANNPVALTVPCHRIIRGNGDIGGYGGGVERKRKLLASEARAALREPQGERKKANG
jgi:AraC family transcriptional regulator of adaptative response/methylated-DNA-[protein]-cysteine methyltransferase